MRPIRPLVLLTLATFAPPALAQVNVGTQGSEASLPFDMTQVATFQLPWRLAFLPDGRMLVTEKTGPVWLVTQSGVKTPVGNVPAVLYGGQGGMLGVYLSPRFATDRFVYLTYSEPGDGGSSLALSRAKLNLSDTQARLDDLQVIWRDGARGKGGQFGGAVAFAPDGNSLFLTVGERQRMTPAQDPNQPLGKILRLTLDGKPFRGNPGAGKDGAASVPVIDPPRDTELAKSSPIVRTYTFAGKNLTPAETWTVGHRTPYGLAFAPDGRLWEVEHGPRGGDELNLIEPGKNYGWPLVSYAVNYNGVAIPSPETRADLTKPVLYWTPIIAPGNLTFYKGAAFPAWNGSALIGGMATKTLNRIVIDGTTAKPAERWDVGRRIRDVEVAPDGSLWMLEDANPGGMFHVTPATAGSAPRADSILIHDEKSAPENLAVGPDGMLYVGSASTPYVYTVAKGATTATRFIDASAAGLGTFFFGILADPKSNTLWTCQLTPVAGSAPLRRTTALRGFDLRSAAPKLTWTLPGDNSVCNDFAIGPDGALYISDTANQKIFRLAPGAQTAQLYLDDRRLLGIDGITFLNGQLYVNNVFFNKLYRIPVAADGKPGAPVDIWMDAPVRGPDGMRAADGKLYVAENASGKISSLTINGDTAHVTVLKEGLSNPTGIEPADGTLWFTERGTGKVWSIPAP